MQATALKFPHQSHLSVNNSWSYQQAHTSTKWEKFRSAISVKSVKMEKLKYGKEHHTKRTCGGHG